MRATIAASRLHSASSLASSATTIFALSTAPAPGALAIVRVSGERAGAALLALTRSTALPKPRIARACALFSPSSRDKINEPPLDPSAITLFFKGPYSSTGEDIAEFHVHGGRGVAAATLRALGSLPGLTPAQAGDFSRRAAANGRLDLLGAEALADLIAADTEFQRAAASSRVANSALASSAARWKDRLVGALAALEALLDFGGGDNAIDEVGVCRNAASTVENVRRELTAALAGAARGIALREGVRIAIIGAPNAGKSSLLNSFADRPVALVSATAGTTRDVVEVAIDVGGVRATIADTAGLRRLPRGGIEAEGILRAQAAAIAADIILFVVDARAVGRGSARTLASLRSALASLKAQPLRDGARVLLVANKCDGDGEGAITKIAPAEAVRRTLLAVGEFENVPIYRVSCVTGAGISTLLDVLGHEAAAAAWGGAALGEDEGPPLLSRERHTAIVKAVDEACNRVIEQVNATEIVLAAEELRIALDGLGKLTGDVGAEDVLDKLFATFCVGK